MKRGMIFLLIVLVVGGLGGCSHREVYQLGPKFGNLKIIVGGDIRKDWERCGGDPDKEFAGFYCPVTHEIFLSEKDFNLLLHELWHASGYREEPPWPPWFLDKARKRR
jgi:hypothetical protein